MKTAICIHGVALLLDVDARCFECEKAAIKLGLPPGSRQCNAVNVAAAFRESQGASRPAAPPTPTPAPHRGLREDSLRALFDSLRTPHTQPEAAPASEAEADTGAGVDAPHPAATDSETLADLREQHAILERLYLQQREELHEATEDARRHATEAQDLRVKLLRIGRLVKSVTEPAT